MDNELKAVVDKATTLEKIAGKIAELRELSEKLSIVNVKDHIEKAELKHLVAFQADLKTLLDNSKDVRSELNKTYEFLRTNIIPMRMDDDGLDSITVTGVGRVNLQADVYASIVTGQKEAAFEWLEENELGDMIVENVNAQTLKAFARRRVKEGDLLPDTLFNVTPYTFAKITRSK